MYHLQVRLEIRLFLLQVDCEVLVRKHAGGQHHFEVGQRVVVLLLGVLISQLHIGASLTSIVQTDRHKRQVASKQCPICDHHASLIHRVSHVLLAFRVLDRNLQGVCNHRQYNTNNDVCDTLSFNQSVVLNVANLVNHHEDSCKKYHDPDT